jgi:hypothetical protein
VSGDQAARAPNRGKGLLGFGISLVCAAVLLGGAYYDLEIRTSPADVFKSMQSAAREGKYARFLEHFTPGYQDKLIGRFVFGAMTTNMINKDIAGKPHKEAKALLDKYGLDETSLNDASMLKHGYAGLAAYIKDKPGFLRDCIEFGGKDSNGSGVWTLVADELILRELRISGQTAQAEAAIETKTRKGSWTIRFRKSFGGWLIDDLSHMPIRWPKQ